jgi:transcriptional regulator with XRE-family HTH domain
VGIDDLSPLSPSADELQSVEGGALKRLRAESGLTQQKVAETLKCKPEQVSQWENGRVRPQPRNLVGLLRVLGRSVADYAAAMADEARTREGEKSRDRQWPDSSPPHEEIRELSSTGETHYGDDVVRIQIKELSLLIPADRFSISHPGSLFRSRRRDE